MKILIICQYYYPDPFRLKEVAEGLADLGHKVTVLTGTPNYVAKSTNENDYDYYSNKKNLKIIRVKTYRRNTSLKSIAISYFTYMINASVKALKLKKNYDVIFVYQLSPILMVIPALIFSKKSKKKIALYCLDLWPESMIGMGISHNSILYKIMRLFSRYTYNHIDYLGYTSKSFKNYFVNDLKLKQTKYKYIPQFAEDIYQNIQNEKHEKINYVFAGNIGEAQDVENIIKAASLVKNENIRWHIVGDGRSLDSCKKLALKLKLDDKVIFYGRKPLSEMPKYFSIADAMIVTLSNNDIIAYTLPGKVQSYMAAGKAIIGAATGELPLIMSEAKCGLCCDPGEPQKLADIADEMAIIDRKQFETNSKNYYLNNFTKQKHIDDIEHMLETIR